MSSHKHPDPVVADAITKLEDEGRKVQIIGQIKNGKIEIDPSDLADLAAKHPNLVFLAMNSPFDPVVPGSD
ncbi:MAG TPA: hypothetical protein VGD37_19905 [Kofleriaceae bacterium]